jgi:hypothetical protein
MPSTMPSTMIDIGKGNYLHKPDWHLTLDEAQKHAEKMRLRAICSTERRLHQLKNLKIKEAKSTTP